MAAVSPRVMVLRSWGSDTRTKLAVIDNPVSDDPAELLEQARSQIERDELPPGTYELIEIGNETSVSVNQDGLTGLTND